MRRKRQKRITQITSSVALFEAGDRNMVDQEVIGSQLHPDRFPFQSEGDITLAVRNANYTLGPVMLHIVIGTVVGPIAEPAVTGPGITAPAGFCRVGGKRDKGERERSHCYDQSRKLAH